MMNHRAQAFKSVSEAIRLDSSGSFQIAYAKYLQGLQQLCNILTDQYNLLGYTKILENAEEAKQLLSLVGECAERMDSILCSKESHYVKENKVWNRKHEDLGIGSLYLNENSRRNGIGLSAMPPKNALEESRFPALEKAKKENIQLLKQFQPRIENAKDERIKTNLKLELHRRLTENMGIARAKQAEIIHQQQKEKQLAFKAAEKELLSSQPYLSELDVEKKKTYVLVLQYEANRFQVSPLTSDVIVSTEEAVNSIFKRIFLCHDHPLAKWLVRIQTKMKSRIDKSLVEYSALVKYLPGAILDGASKTTTSLPSQCKVEIRKENAEASNNLLHKISTLEECLSEISSDIRTSIDDVLETFLHAYRMQLPAEAESTSYKFIESFFLEPLWPSLILLFRIVNLQSELNLADAMSYHSKFSIEVSYGTTSNGEFLYEDVIFQLRSLPYMFSLIGKLNLLVEISQKLCGGMVTLGEGCDKERKEKLLGADELIPVLCSIVLQTKISQLVSECHALEQLVDQKYMLGEEGYSLTSFQTALKYLETEKFIQEACDRSSTDEN